MNWSKYNLIYQSERHGWLLFNMLSGTFLDLNDDEIRDSIQSIKESYDIDAVLKNDDELKNFLLSSAIINEHGDSDNIAILKMRSLMNRYDKAHRTLVLLPTLDCNLRCSYCFIGGNVKPLRMSDKVIEQVKKYIKTNCTNIEQLKISWFGGEPLYEWGIIKEISNYIKSLGINFFADIVTNGTLLTREVIESLDFFHIIALQVTFDGLRSTHDQKRVFQNGNGTYDLIMENLDYLHEYIAGKNYMKVNIRINVDKENRDEYHKLHDIIQTKYPRFVIYPGVLMAYKSCSSAINCFPNQKEVAEFWMEQYQKYGIDDIQYYPLVKGTGACLAENPYSTVIGPEGEQYPCLKDVGDENEIIGNIFDETQNINLISHYTVKNFCYDNDQCVKCHAIALCGGGCPNLKYRNNKYHENHDYCAQFKNINIMKKYLDIHYEIKKKYAKEVF